MSGGGSAWPCEKLLTMFRSEMPSEVKEISGCRQRTPKVKAKVARKTVPGKISGSLKYFPETVIQTVAPRKSGSR